VDFLVVLTELFSLGVTAEALRAIVIGNWHFWRKWVSFSQIFK